MNLRTPPRREYRMLFAALRSRDWRSTPNSLQPTHVCRRMQRFSCSPGERLANDPWRTPLCTLSARQSTCCTPSHRFLRRSCTSTLERACRTHTSHLLMAARQSSVVAMVAPPATALIMSVAVAPMILSSCPTKHPSTFEAICLSAPLTCARTATIAPLKVVAVAIASLFMHLVIASFSKTCVPRSLEFSFVPQRTTAKCLRAELADARGIVSASAHTTAPNSVNHASRNIQVCADCHSDLHVRRRGVKDLKKDMIPNHPSESHHRNFAWRLHVLCELFLCKMQVKPVWTEVQNDSCASLEHCRFRWCQHVPLTTSSGTCTRFWA